MEPGALDSLPSPTFPPFREFSSSKWAASRQNRKTQPGGCSNLTRLGDTQKIGFKSTKASRTWGAKIPKQQGTRKASASSKTAYVWDERLKSCLSTVPRSLKKPSRECSSLTAAENEETESKDCHRGGVPVDTGGFQFSPLDPPSKLSLCPKRGNKP